MPRFAFVLEQTLGHVSHGRNIERALSQEPDIESTVIRLEYPPRGVAVLPLLRNWSLRASWAARRALLQRLSQGRLDAIFVHTQVASLLSTSIMRSVPTVISLDATPFNIDDLGIAYRHQRGARPVEALKRRINQHAFASARAVVTWCQWAAKSLERDYGVDAGKIEVVHPGVDLGLFRPRELRPENARPRLLFVGGDFTRKGGPELLEAVRSLDGGFELDIVSGSAPDLSGGYRVHPGLAPQSQELLELFRRADIFVLPTRGDCFPQAIAEALASGLPVVATDIGGIREMVTPGVNGYLVPPRSPQELARALRSLIEAPLLRQRMGKASLARAQQTHDSRRNNRAIFELMSRLATTPQPVLA
jgi:glycosyltransferase involved in cell wall biosynthesis